jgi:hypothetical protein
MGNTLTGLIPTIYDAMDVVSREMVGFIPAVSRDSSAVSAAVGQTITTFQTPEATAYDVTPGATPPDNGDQVIAPLSMTISKSRYAPIRWTGEEQRSVSGQRTNIMRDQIAQGMRTLVNEVESDLGALYIAASRAYGTAGTTPFGTAGDLSDLSETNRILKDNGAPRSSLQCVLGSAAVAKIQGKQSTLFKVNEAGTDAMLRTGDIGVLEGFAMHDSAGVKSHTKGTGTGYLSNNASGYAIGATEIAEDTGTGTVLAGDVVTFAGDTNKYIVATALTAGNIVIAEPGLRQTLADNVAMTVGNNYTANAAFSRNAIQLLTRSPIMPEEGDSADDVLTIEDPFSGISFQFALYREHRRVKIEIGLAWGTKAVKPEHMALLLG